MAAKFWSSVVLTGDPTCVNLRRGQHEFWSSVVLTGDPTAILPLLFRELFWSSVVLTGDVRSQEIPDPLYQLVYHFMAFQHWGDK